MFVRSLSPGDSEVDFNLFVESEKRLVIERIHHAVKVVESGSTNPDWLEIKEPEQDKTGP